VKRLTSDYWEQKRETLKSYEAMSDAYDELYGEEQLAKYVSAAQLLNSQEKYWMLDCGCGTGSLAKRFSRQLVEVVGVDYSTKMLDKALAKSKWRGNIHLVRADVDFLPVRNHVFQRAFSFTVLQNMPDPSRTLRELLRVSKDRAMFVITILKQASSKDDFIRVLNNSTLKIVKFLDNEGLKDYVAVCTAVG